MFQHIPKRVILVQEIADRWDNKVIFVTTKLSADNAYREMILLIA